MICDWCGVRQPTMITVLGNTQTGETEDANLCEHAVDNITSLQAARAKAQDGELIVIYLSSRGKNFYFDMWETWPPAAPSA